MEYSDNLNVNENDDVRDGDCTSGESIRSAAGSLVPASTQSILDATFSFTDLSSLDSAFGSAFDHVVGITDATNVDKIIGGSESDTFYIQDNYDTVTMSTSLLTLDGGLEADEFNFYADPGNDEMNIKVHDIGEALKDENVINIWGSSGADTISVTGTNAEGGNIDLGNSQTIEYIAPDPNTFADQLIINIFGQGGDDIITVESTFITVPVRVEGGEGDDIMTAGDGTLNDLYSFLNANANDGFGFGPLVFIGGAGHDSLIVDDSADGDNPENEGNINAFLEKREGVPELVEIGVISGLGMTMSIPDVAPSIGTTGFPAKPPR